MSGDPLVRRGVVKVVFAYDVGLAIDLERAKQAVTDMTELAQIRHRGHAPSYFQFDPPPLRVRQEIAPIDIGAFRSGHNVDVLLFDFGGLSVTYTIPCRGNFEDLVELSCLLTETQRFLDDSHTRVMHLLAVIESSVDRAQLADVSEDYVIFQVEELESEAVPGEFVRAHAATIARILRAERGKLSEQEVNDVMASKISYTDADVCVLDWNAAFLLDRDPGDVRAVLEFANLQLLEMRFLDGQLDRALDRSYELLVRPRSLGRVPVPGKLRHELARVSTMQVDSAILFERVSNALKLVGDQYLARVYRATAQRFRLNEWNTTILRKLETIESIYDKIHDHSSAMRMELLEWIVIALIAFEVVIQFVR